MPRRTILHLAPLALLATACATPRVRPVVDVVPLVTAVEVTLTQQDRAVEDDHVDGFLERELAGISGPTPVRRVGFARLLGDDGPTQLDPEEGPIDLGLALHVNFGAGQAPYDDAMAPVHGVVPGRTGFSDSVLQVTWRERVGRTYGLHGTAALTRFQDLAIVEGIADAEFAWFVLGVHTSF